MKFNNDFDPLSLLNQHTEAINNHAENLVKLELFIRQLAESQRTQAQLLENLSQQNTVLLLAQSRLLDQLSTGNQHEQTRSDA